MGNLWHVASLRYRSQDSQLGTGMKGRGTSGQVTFSPTALKENNERLGEWGVCDMDI